MLVRAVRVAAHGVFEHAGQLGRLLVRVLLGNGIDHAQLVGQLAGLGVGWEVGQPLMRAVLVLRVDPEELRFNAKGMCCGDVRLAVDLLRHVALHLDSTVPIGRHVHTEAFLRALLERCRADGACVGRQDDGIAPLGQLEFLARLQGGRVGHPRDGF